MGKSPGKWIKTVLFGKKSSKSNISKGREKLVNQKEALVVAKASDTGLALDPTPNTIVRDEVDIEPENREAENVLPGSQEIDIVGHQDAPPDPEKIRQEEAATKAQAAFRGYLARRAFKALKGIIRLQALIRGHLVRRQAVATLCCMYRIVKLQALVRGGIVRQIDFRFEMHEKFYRVKSLNGQLVNPDGISTKIAKLSANTFTHKLLTSSTTTMALRIQYVHGDPNSVLSWLERWSASHFWKPVPQPKRIPDLKSHRKLGNGETLMSKSRRTNRKLPAANLDSVPVQANSEFEKPKRNYRKGSGQPTDSVQENPQNELEKVKRNLRKVHNPVVENAVQSDVESETPKQHLEKGTVTSGQGVSEQGFRTKRKVHNPGVENAVQSDVESETPKQRLEKGTVTSGQGVSEQGVISSNEKIKKEAALTMSNVPDVEVTRPSVTKEVFDTPSNYQATQDLKPLTENTSKDKNISGDEAINEPNDLPDTSCNDENTPITNGDLSHKEEPTGNENQKPTRKASIQAKQELAENGVQNNPILPSYMAATESAKAKLRAQGSPTPRLGQDGGERNNVARRHSLPSSTNSKISSHSPRMQRPVQAGGKGGHRTDRTMSSSRDGNGKVIQAEWRR